MAFSSSLPSQTVHTRPEVWTVFVSLLKAGTRIPDQALLLDRALHVKSLNVVLRLRRRMCGEACLAGAELKQRGYAPGFWAKGRTRGSAQSN